MDELIEIIDQGNGVVYIFDSEAAYQEWNITKRATYLEKRQATSEELAFNPF
jgi:hypothetical protein